MTGSTVSFAFVAGTVATVNPWGFALLPAYLARVSAPKMKRAAAGFAAGYRKASA
jgi:cytochrome c biogenesis protein CcdA